MLLKSLEIEQELGHKEGMAIQYANLGFVHQGRDLLDKACECWTTSHNLYSEIGIKHRVEQVEGWMRDADCPKDDEC